MYTSGHADQWTRAELACFHELADRLDSSAAVDRCAAFTLEALRTLAGACAGAVYLRDGTAWRLVASEGEWAAILPQSHIPGQAWPTWWGQLVEQQRTVRSQQPLDPQNPFIPVPHGQCALSSWIAVPCVAGGQARALLFIASRRRKGFQEHTILFVEQAASYLARSMERNDYVAALESAKAHSQQLGRELSALNAISATVSEAQDITSLLQTCLAQVLQVMRLRAGWVFLSLDSGRRLGLVAEQGLSRQFADEEARLPLGDCACSLVVRTGEPVIVEDLLACPRLRPATLQDEGLQAHASVPLKSKNMVLGVMNVAADDPQELRGANLELLTAIGRYLGVAIDGALSFATTLKERATLRSVMESMVDGLILVDTEGKITYWNPRASEFLGIAGSSATGKPAMGIARRIAMGSTQPERVSEQLAEAFLHFEEFPVIEYELLRPTNRTVQSLLFPIVGDRSEALGFGITLRDVTREKESDRMKLQLLSTVSHELRTPLASIKGFASTLLRQDVRWDEKTQQDFVQIIDEESDRLSELVDNLLDMSRIEAGTLRIEKEQVQLCTLLTDVIETTRLHSDRHTFVLEAPPIPPVIADPRRVRQVVHNLLQNAIKYSPKGGKITVLVEMETNRVIVHVTDQGIGIPKAQQRRIFDRFFQVDSASTRVSGGSGLGLAISKSIIEAHGGQMWFGSEPGQGSTFSFALPISS